LACWWSACVVWWREFQQASILDFTFPFGDLPVQLPAAVLLLAGFGTLLIASARKLRFRHPDIGPARE